MRTAIIGAGIGGLCTAVGLRRAGAEVTVFEQAADLRPGGAGLSVFANGVRALDALGLGTAFREITSTRAGELRAGQRRPDGSWLATVPPDAAGTRVADRAQLHAMLVATLADGTIQPGTRLEDAQQDGTVTLRGSGGTYADRFDVVVAADGLRSTVRAAWDDDPGIRYAGYAAWRGITARPVDLHGEAGETWGRGLRFGMAPLADGRVYWFAVATMPAEETCDDETAALRTRFAGWHPPIPELLEATPADEIHRLPINELAGRLGTYRRGRLVLLGDAAHAMTPNLGQGGGLAMEDAATLTALLTPVTGSPANDDGPLDAALTRYDAERRTRTQRIAQRSRSVGRLAHLDSPAAIACRDLMLRLTPEWALRKQVAQVQNWQPPDS